MGQRGTCPGPEGGHELACLGAHCGQASLISRKPVRQGHISSALQVQMPDSEAFK